MSSTSEQDLKLWLSLQFIYKTGCNWNINGYQCITYNNTYLCTSMPSTIPKPIVQNAGAFYLQTRGISIHTVQTPTEVKPKYYKPSTSDDLPSDLIPLAVSHKINHKYPKLLNIPILNMTDSRIYILKSTIFRMLKPVEIENLEISEISWIKIENLNKNTIENFEEVYQH